MTEQSAKADNSTGRAVRIASRLSRLYLDALRANDAAGAFQIVSSALGEGMTVPQMYQRVITPAMREIGELWEKGALTVADEHQATALTHRVLAALRPPLGAGDTGVEEDAPAGKSVLLAAVEGERHALGLRMAADVLEDVGFRTIYLGADVPTDALLQAVAALSPDLVALSATLPELGPRLEEVAGIVRGAHPGIDVLVGGQAAPPRGEAATLAQDLETLPEKV